MTSVEPISAEVIFSSTRRVPFSATDIHQMSEHLNSVRRNGLDLSIDCPPRDIEEMLRDGVVLLRSSDLQADFLFANVDGGTGFFGSKKTKCLTYHSDLYRNQFSPGPVLGSLLRALVGINNLYRHAGLLRGPAL